MKPTKIYLISPREPSGATWLINCLLELGVMTYRETLGNMWNPVQGGRYTLNPVENHLKKWLPILSKNSVFQFRQDIEVEWAHHWPTRRHARHRVIYFVRDPRDALFSRYRREAPDISYEEFLEFPDPQTLLDKIDTWSMFSQLWLRQPDCRFFRFEDYKSDARQTLIAILEFAGLKATESELMLALQNSTFDKAALSEKEYRKANPEDAQLINRASQVGNWQMSNEAVCAARISGKTGRLLAHFGYTPGNSAGASGSFLPQASVLDFYRRLAIEPSFWLDEQTNDNSAQRLGDSASQLIRFLTTLDDDKLRCSGLTPYEIHTLLRSLEEFAGSLTAWRLQQLDWPKNHRAARVWWRVMDCARTHNIRLPPRLSVWLGRFRSIFKDRFLRT